jgi:hypothetical protein
MVSNTLNINCVNLLSFSICLQDFRQEIKEENEVPADLPALLRRSGCAKAMQAGRHFRLPYVKKS